MVVWLARSTPFLTVTDQYQITPSHELVRLWFLEASELPVDQWITDITTQSACWGYEQGRALNEAELQKARDEELEAIIAWMTQMGYWGEDGKVISALRAARRPRTKNQAEEALKALDSVASDLRHIGEEYSCDVIYDALERLRELESQ